MCPTAIGVEPLLGPGRGFGPSTRVLTHSAAPPREARTLARALGPLSGTWCLGQSGGSIQDWTGLTKDWTSAPVPWAADLVRPKGRAGASTRSTC